MAGNKNNFLKAPFPYFGGKSRVADAVWRRFGKVNGFVDPFCGSCSVLFANPNWPDCAETINDLDGCLTNVWRSLRHDPEQTAYYADDIVSECCLHAKHSLLVREREELTERLTGDPEYFDAKLAGYWIWGMCIWIGGGWCSGEGPWHVVDGRMVCTMGGDGSEVWQQLPILSRGVGVNRQLPHLGDWGKGINRKRPHLFRRAGINQNSARGGGRSEWILDWFSALSERLRDVRIVCGDWSRVLGPTPTTRMGMTAVAFFMDPPYSDGANRKEGLYARDCLKIANDVRQWCIENGDNPLFRIAYCSYGERPMPESWKKMRWRTVGGYGSQGNGQGRKNKEREVIYFSPHCTNPELSLFPDTDLFDSEHKQ